jgi:hypothetical protein
LFELPDEIYTTVDSLLLSDLISLEAISEQITKVPTTCGQVVGFVVAD